MQMSNKISTINTSSKIGTDNLTTTIQKITPPSSTTTTDTTTTTTSATNPSRQTNNLTEQSFKLALPLLTISGVSSASNTIVATVFNSSGLAGRSTHTTPNSKSTNSQLDIKLKRTPSSSGVANARNTNGIARVLTDLSNKSNIYVKKNENDDGVPFPLASSTLPAIHTNNSSSKTADVVKLDGDSSSKFSIIKQTSVVSDNAISLSNAHRVFSASSSHKRSDSIVPVPNLINRKKATPNNNPVTFAKPEKHMSISSVLTATNTISDALTDQQPADHKASFSTISTLNSKDDAPPSSLGIYTSAALYNHDEALLESETQKATTKEEKDAHLKEFDLMSTIGAGTFGRVLLARHQITRKYYALKVMSITEIVRLKHVEHVKNEKSMLEESHACPFIVRLYFTHHTIQHLYMLLEYVPGGDFFTILKQRNRLETRQAVFYTCEIVVALDFLHAKLIVYRDLKPENLLLGVDGHLKLADFGFAKKLVRDRTYTLCGTPEYMAPELLHYRGHDTCCDWWSLGILIFEFLSGTTPFYDEDRNKVYEKILAGKIEWPRHFDSSSKDIIRKLLVQDPTKRLGSGNCGILNSNTLAKNTSDANALSNSNNMASSTENTLTNATSDNNALSNFNNIVSSISTAAATTKTRDISTVFLTQEPVDLGIEIQQSNVKQPLSTGNQFENLAKKIQKNNMGSEEVKNHRWFISIGDWFEVYEKRIKPPIMPEILHPGDTRNFEKFDFDPQDLNKTPMANEREYNVFLNF